MLHILYLNVLAHIHQAAVNCWQACSFDASTCFDQSADMRPNCWQTCSHCTSMWEDQLADPVAHARTFPRADFVSESFLDI